MKFKYIVYLLFTLLLIYSCNDDNESTYENRNEWYSTDAQIYSFTLSAKALNSKDPEKLKRDTVIDSILKTTRFVIDQKNMVIYNPDSLPFGISDYIDTLKMNLSFNVKYGISKLQLSYKYLDFFDVTSSIAEWKWTGSVNFTQDSLPIRIKVIPPKTDAFPGEGVVYTVDLRIRKTEPQKMNWEKAGSLTKKGGNISVLLNDNIIYTFVKEGNNCFLIETDIYNSTTKSSVPITGLPSDINIKSITFFQDNFYAITINGDSYLSDSSGLNWQKKNNNYFIQAIYGILPTDNGNTLLIAVNQEGNYYWATTEDMVTIQIIDEIAGFGNNIISNDFPLEGFATATHTQGGNNFLIIVGGIHNGTELNRLWLIKKTSQGLTVTPSSRQSFLKGSGMSTFLYDGQVYIFNRNKFYTSSSWGQTWNEIADDKANLKDQSTGEEMHKRNGQSIITDSSNKIWIFGGISEDGTQLDDIWKGGLNKFGSN